MLPLAVVSGDLAPFLLELGALVATLALLARLAGALGLSPIPFYLLAGLALGDRGVIPLGFSEGFVAAGPTSASCCSSSRSASSSPAPTSATACGAAAEPAWSISHSTPCPASSPR